MRIPVRAVLLALGVGACGGAGEASSSRVPETGSGGAAHAPLAARRVGEIEVGGVLAPAPVPGGDAPPIAVYLALVNHGAGADTLDRVELAGARASLHAQSPAGSGMAAMIAVPHLPLPAGETVRLRPGGHHVMVEGLARKLVPGDTLALTLVLRRAGPLHVAARVVSYGDVERLLAPGDEHASH